MQKEEKQSGIQSPGGAMVGKKTFFSSLTYFCNFSYGEDLNVAFLEEVNPN